jgi:hypothetical protein
LGEARREHALPGESAADSAGGSSRGNPDLDMAEVFSSALEQDFRDLGGERERSF